MGILSAMNNSVGGIAAQSFALENISGNIANSQTTAYKRTDTSFSDLVPSGTSYVHKMTSGNVMASSRSSVGIDGDVQASDVDTYMAIRGGGFFQVGASTTDSTPFYTRRGDFQLDNEGFLVNGSGYYLRGYSEPYVDGDVRTLEPIQINKDSINAEATEKVTYALNVPSTPSTTFSTSNTDDTVTTPDIWTDDTYRTNAATVASAGIVVGGDQETEFLANSISGGSVTAYNSQGTAVNLQLRWAKFADNEWGLYYQSNSSADSSTAAWTQVSGGAAGTVLANAFTFDTEGQLTTDVVLPVTITAPSINGVTLNDLTFDVGITQFAETDGQTTVQTLSQDGSPVGYFDSMSISDDGKVVYSYSNGKTEDKWDIPLVAFRGQSALRPEDGGAYSETMDSGPPSEIDGTIVGSSLESSNVDISEEFTKMIVTQQAFSANSKVINTANQMMSDILNIIR